MRLIHYEADRGSPSGWRSAIHSEEFFLAPEDGPTNPRAELAATLAAMEAAGNADADADPDMHAQCRFPARRQWLVARLGDSLPFAIRDCPKFDGWNRSHGVESISVVLATGYLGNPASYYGHTLLKFNFVRDDRRTPLQDVSVNYGAILTGNDDPLTYMAKGVFGGYEGGFSHVHYYFHNHNYGENELRDMWEYRLDLSPDAVRLIVAHAWEVLGKRYNYYFFRKNCAFRMAEVLQVVDGLEFIPGNRPWTIPQAMLQRLAASTNPQGGPLLAEVSYHPSRQTRFYNIFQSLNAEESQLFNDLVRETEQLDGERFQKQAPGVKHAVLDSLIDYYQFIADPEERATGKVHPGYARALVARYRLPAGFRQVAREMPAQPHLGRLPSWLQVGWLHDELQGPATFLRIRPAYYDALDTGSGHVPHASLVMGDLQLRAKSGRVRIHRFDLVAIESINPGLTGLPGDRGGAWKLKLGAEPARLSCGHCLVARFQGDMGIGRRLTDSVFAAVYGGGAIQSNRFGQGTVFARASADLLFKLSRDWGMRLGLEQRLPIRATQSAYMVTQAEIRYAFGNAGDFRIRHEYDRVGMTTVGFGLYW